MRTRGAVAFPAARAATALATALAAAGRAAPALAAAVAAGLALLSAADPGRVPAPALAALVLLPALSAWRPAAGLVAVAALVPVAGWLSRFGVPLRLAEALVLAVLAGALARLALDGGRRAGPAALAPGPGPAAVLLAAAAAAAVAVELAVAQAGVRDFRTLEWLGALRGDYLFRGWAGVTGLVDAARLIEGAALLLVVLAWSRRDAGLPRRLAAATLAGAAGAAAVNLYVLLEDLLAAESAATLAGYLRGSHRLAGHVRDVNATGSYFLLAGLAGLGLIAGRRGARPAALPAPAAAAVLAAGAACWLSGSRSALAAAALVGLAGGAWWAWTRRPRGRLGLAAAGALAAALLALPLAVAAAYPGRGDGAAADSLRHRIEFTTRSLRMWRTEPLFGVGAGRYLLLSEQFAGDGAAPRFRRENAHNNFLQIAAELGAAGIAAFLALLAACAGRAWRALRARDGPDPLLAGAGAGAAAYLLTCLTGHPLLTGETAYPFWIVLGVAAARAERLLPAPGSGARRAAATGWAAGLLLLASVPFRTDAAVQGLTAGQPRSVVDDLRGGTFGPETGPRGRCFRWSGPYATFLAPGDARAVRVPLRAPHARLDRPVTVEIALGGRPARRIPLLDGRWTTVPLPLAPDPPGGVHRVDLTVDPPWTPRERRNGDGRTLGVQVGALALDGGDAPGGAGGC